mmetsp:Transcript_8315/g.25699  ORF Transcript_8315/g.25699 Transcript_8315/m.25699 type:complete len:211 (-) Transcript_8315:1154-1786(-)
MMARSSGEGGGKRKGLPEEEPDEDEQRGKVVRRSASRANILITGTPGTGKSETCEAIARALGLEHVSVSALAETLEAYDGWDEERKCHILDEDKVLDAMEETVGKVGGFVVEYHACDLFPERWFDLVVVLRAATHVLYDRLQARGYAADKIQENVTCEITDLLLTEARDAYDAELVVELTNDTREDLASNLHRIRLWHDAWVSRQQHHRE